MRIIEVETVVEGVLLEVRVWLENCETHLGYDGARTWKSIDRVAIQEDVLQVNFHGIGLIGSPWKLMVHEVQPPKETKIIDGSGKIQAGGHSFVLYAGCVLS